MASYHAKSYATLPVYVSDHAIDQFRARCPQDSVVLKYPKNLIGSVIAMVRSSESGPAILRELEPWLSLYVPQKDSQVIYHRESRVAFVVKVVQTKLVSKIVVLTCFRANCQFCLEWPCQCAFPALNTLDYTIPANSKIHPNQRLCSLAPRVVRQYVDYASASEVRFLAHKMIDMLDLAT